MFPISHRAGGKLLSRTALAVVLACGVAGGAALTAGPALAKDAKEAKPSNSPAFVKVAGPMQKQVQDLLAKKGKASAADLKAEAAALVPQVSGLDPLLTTPLDKIIGGQWQYQVGSLAGDEVLAAKGLNKMLESGQLQPEGAKQVRVQLGQYAYLAKDYPKVIEIYTPIAADPTVDPAVPQMLAQAYVEGGNSAAGLDATKRAIEARKTAGGTVPSELFERGLAIAYKAKDYNGAFYFASKLVEAYPNESNWGDAIAVVRTANAFQAQETLDVMRLMERTHSYRDTRDFAEYLQAADARRSPGEVLKVLDEGLKAGKLQANDVFVSENRSVAQSRLAADKASLPALERDAAAPNASGVTIMAAADTLLSYDQPAKAEPLYRAALGKPGVDADRALTRLGIAQVDQGKYADAQATFAKVNGQRKSIATLWSIYAAQKAKGG